MSKWIIVEKHEHNRMKKDVKARIVASCFQGDLDSQPTVLKYYLKTMMSVAANEGHELCSIDIKGAFL